MEARREIRGFLPKNPVDVLLAAQPGELALGVLPGAELHLCHGIPGRGVAPVDGQKLLIADGLEGCGGFRQATFKQGFHLLQKSLGHHGIHPAVDALIEIGPVPEGKADGIGPVLGGTEAGARIVGGDGLAGLPKDLQGPEDALFIAQVQAGGSCGVNGL